MIRIATVQLNHSYTGMQNIHGIICCYVLSIKQHQIGPIESNQHFTDKTAKPMNLIFCSYVYVIKFVRARVPVYDVLL